MAGVADMMDLLGQAQKTIAAQNRRIQALESLNVIDEETGFYNRKGFSKALRREIAAVRRGLGTGGLVVFIDVENYESILRDHGPGALKGCLNLMARTIEGKVREMDIPGYFGGGRFAVLFRDGEPGKVAGRLQKTALMLGNLSFVHEEREIGIGIGLRLRPYNPDDTDRKIIYPE